MARVLVDASNLHVGGGVQVAASFLDEVAGPASSSLVGQFDWLDSVTYEASTAVSNNVTARTRSRLNLLVVDRSWRSVQRWVPGRDRFDVSFVVFGPEYGLSRARKRISGFADVTTVVQPPQSVQATGLYRRGRFEARKRVSRASFARQDALITESEEMKSALVALGRSPEAVHVVPNTYNGVFDQPSRWLPVRVDRSSGDTLLAYATRPYAHKNLDFLPLVRREFRRGTGESLRFAVTLTDQEWAARSATFQDACVNVGRLSVEQLPALYEACDGAIFPSLLEAFSVMPLEAMRMSRLVFASDRGFVRTVCGDTPVYINPLDPHATAQVIAEVLADPEQRHRHIASGTALVGSHPTPFDRARSYLAIIQQELAKQT